MHLTNLWVSSFQKINASLDANIATNNQLHRSQQVKMFWYCTNTSWASVPYNIFYHFNEFINTFCFTSRKILAGIWNTGEYRNMVNRRYIT